MDVTTTAWMNKSCLYSFSLRTSFIPFIYIFIDSEHFWYTGKHTGTHTQVLERENIKLIFNWFLIQRLCSGSLTVCVCVCLQWLRCRSITSNRESRWQYYDSFVLLSWDSLICANDSIDFCLSRNDLAAIYTLHRSMYVPIIWRCVISFQKAYLRQVRDINI